MDIFEEITRLKKDGRASALATIVQAVGSSPQKEGSKMLVREDGTTEGTLGGGCMEAEVILAALVSLKDGAPSTFQFELNEKQGGLVCGGKVSVFIEPIIPQPDLIILGAGHVGKALAKVAGFAGFRVTVSDDRSEHANADNLPDADVIVVNSFRDIFTKTSVNEKTYIVIATRGHNHDLEAMEASLKTAAGYVGLLGSRRKKALLFKTLREQGFSDDDLNRIHTPVGLSIGAVTPEEIAVSIIAEMIAVRRTGPRSCTANSDICSH